jgi:hypothetical protein
MRCRFVFFVRWRQNLLAVPACLALATAACEAPSSSISGVTDTRLGDTLVVTTDPGTDQGPSLYTVELDLTIGELDGPEEYVLHPTSVSAEEEGKIFGSDQRAGEIRIFDHHGQFLRRFGQRGDGPGEFSHRTQPPLGPPGGPPSWRGSIKCSP